MGSRILPCGTLGVVERGVFLLISYLKCSVGEG